MQPTSVTAPLFQTTVFTLLLSCWVLPTMAEEPARLPETTLPANANVRRLTLDEAKQIALAGNRSLALARLNIAEKEFATSAAGKDYFPKVLGDLTYLHFDTNLGQITTVASGKFGLLPAGTVLTNTAVLNQNSALSTILVAQPITKLIAVNAAVKIARADENAARAQLDKGTRDLLSGVAQAYEGLLGARRIQTALELQAKLLAELLSARPIPELRVALVEVQQGLAQLRGQVQQLNDLLNNLLDLPPCTVLELVDPMPPALTVHCADEAAQLALTNNPEVREAEQNIAKAEAALQVARMAYVPDVTIIGAYGNQTAASYIQDNFGYVGLTATYTFWDWGKRREIKQQRDTQIAMAHENLRVTMDKVQLDARKAYVAFEQAREAFQLAGEMVKARKEVEKSATGAAALQAKADTSKAELEYMKDEIAYRVAYAQVAALVCAP
jgi:outer membrane protein TolC